MWVAIDPTTINTSRRPGTQRHVRGHAQLTAVEGDECPLETRVSCEPSNSTDHCFSLRCRRWKQGCSSRRNPNFSERVDLPNLSANTRGQWFLRAINNALRFDRSLHVGARIRPPFVCGFCEINDIWSLGDPNHALYEPRYIQVRLKTENSMGLELTAGTPTALQADTETQRLERARSSKPRQTRNPRGRATRRPRSVHRRARTARRGFEAETRKELERPRTALAQAEVQLASAKATVERLTQGVQNAEAETARVRQERDQLQARAAKAEACLKAVQAELEKITKALERTPESERQAREATAELWGQLEAAGDDKSKAKK